MTSGRPVSRAAAIWVRKPCACASRGLIVVVVIQPGFANADAFGMLGQFDELFSRHVEFFVRRCADGCRRCNQTSSCASAMARMASKRLTLVEIVTIA